MFKQRKDENNDLKKASEKESETDENIGINTKENNPNDLTEGPSEKEASSQLEQGADFPIVGIGASAGGLEAFENFFSNMPADCGCAFVLVTHLDPTHKSLLVDLIKRYTKMNVISAEDRMEVKPNWVYVIPPNQDMTISGGRLILKKPTEPRFSRLPIDQFFRSLAEDKREKAICIVLSGTGSDGTLGVRKIKEVGGMVMVQDPETAKYGGMPSSSINNAVVDYISPPDKMPNELISYVQHIFGTTKPKIELAPLETKDFMKNITDLLYFNTGLDFTAYKENTLFRRIEKRMAVCQISHIAEYYHYLKRIPREINILFKELLIGVTHFYRDKEAFIAFEEKIVPELFKDRDPDDIIRVWVLGCSTGEEAYSIAIILLDYINKHYQDFKLQIYGTDIDDASIEKARAGIYPDSIAADVPLELLEKYFSRKENFYQIKKIVRDSVVFAIQNAIKDPPFSKLDLICCRNLLIYFVPEIQKKLIRLFHYALKPEKFLFLGSSEAISGFEHFFIEIDRKWKLFRKKEDYSDLKELPIFPPLFDYSIKPKEKDIFKQPIEKVSYQQLIESLVLKRYALSSVIINSNNDILYIHGKVGNFLEIPQGETNTNILEMAREGLKLELAMAIRKSLIEKKEVRQEKIRVPINGTETYINIITYPLTDPPSVQGLMVIFFEEVIPEPLEKIKEPIPGIVETAAQQRVKQLEDDLKTTQEYLQTTIEELETSNEELKSTNEELQSSNEELQSTNEELQTSKEELQSVNEELLTVNTELEAKITELAKSYNDMSNFLSSTKIGTAFLDKELKINHFTQAFAAIFNLIPSDIGRPIHHIVPNIRYKTLIQDIEEVLRTLTPKEFEVQTNDLKWYLMKIVPYQTIENVIEGIVLTIIEFTEQKQMKEALQRSEEKYRLLIENAPEGVWAFDRAGILTFVNSRISEILRYTKEEMLGKHIFSFMDENNIKIAKKFIEQTKKEIRETYSLDLIRKDKTCAYTRSAISPIYDDGGVYSGLMGIVEDITSSKEAEEKLVKSELKFNNIQDLIFIYNFKGNILEVNQEAYERLGYSVEEFSKLEMQKITSPKYIELFKNLEERIPQTKNIIFNTEVISRNGQIIPVELNSKIVEYDSKPAILSIARDISHHIEFENMQRQFVYSVSHELRTPISAITQSAYNYDKYKNKLSENQISKLFKIILSNSQTLSGMLKDLQLVVKIEESNLEIKWNRYNLANVCKEAIEALEPLRQLKEIKIECDIDEKNELYGDFRRIRRIFRNIIDNAIKYAKKYSTLTIKAIDKYIGEENPKGIDGVLIQFIDRGIGIQEKDLKHLFKRFFRAEEVMNIPGSGLGLYIVRDLAHLHKGEIFVKSTYGKGSTFSVFLPRLENQPKAEELNQTHEANTSK